MSFTVVCVFASIGGYLLAIPTAALARRRPQLRHAPALLMIVAALIGVAGAVTTLLRGTSQTISGWSIAPFVRIDFRVDPIAAFFLLVISLPAVAAALYGVGYLDVDHETHGAAGHRPPRAFADAALGAFLAAMTLLIVTDTVVGFLFAWELMSLSSFLLVIGDGRGRARRRAAYNYVIMTHAATGFIIFAFLILAAHAHSLQFAAIRLDAAAMSGWRRDGVFLCALIGFGTKAGLIPLHVWLPKAHPAAPSHVSAIMSGVMVKMAIYGLVRVIFELDGPGPRWWGVVLIAAGAASALLGILYALMERDLKRILAYSTVEHLGILTLGLGVATMLHDHGHTDAARLALFAVFVHVLNHSVFKSLLFLGAGAVQTATGGRDLERLGGLIRGMPRTAAFMLIGSAAIAALPPLNGFVGEWLLFQSLLVLGGGSAAWIAMLAAIAAGALALTGALAVACFVRFFGVSFLAQSRTDSARQAREVPRSMQAGMALLATCCIGFGLGATLVMRLIQPAISEMSGGTKRPPVLLGHGAAVSRVTGSYAPLMVALLLAGVGILPWVGARLVGGPGRRRVSPPWVCGNALEPRMQYTATAFAKPIRLIFQFVIRPDRSLTLDEHPESSFVVTAVRYEEGVKPIYDRYFYGRIAGGLVALARRIRPFQSGSIRAYLSYTLVTLVIVILLAR